MARTFFTDRAKPFAFALLVALAAACKRDGARCERCGMKIDESSAWRAELRDGAATPRLFDTPRCAFLTWRSGAGSGASELRAQEFYEKTWRAGRDLRFAIGSDVIGPMGADLVPVDPARASKFAADHHATRVLTEAEITSEVLATLH